jgi:hypothetical protein
LAVTSICVSKTDRIGKSVPDFECNEDLLGYGREYGGLRCDKGDVYAVPSDTGVLKIEFE